MPNECHGLLLCPATRSVNDMSEAERRERQAAIQATMLGGSGGGGVSRADFLYALERSNPSCRWGGVETGMLTEGWVTRESMAAQQSSRAGRLGPLPQSTDSCCAAAALLLHTEAASHCPWPCSAADVERHQAFAQTYGCT